MSRLMSLSLLLFTLSSCGWVPPVNLFDADLKPSPENTGLVYYGETVGPHRPEEILIYRDGLDKPTVSNRAVVILPVGFYTFVYTETVPSVQRITKGPDTPEIVDVPGAGPVVTSNMADGGTFDIVTPSLRSLGINVKVKVEPGRCYKIIEAGVPPERKFEVKEYWPADRSDIKSYCPNSQPKP